jgi:hypothetical protein
MVLAFLQRLQVTSQRRALSVGAVTVKMPYVSPTLTLVSFGDAVLRLQPQERTPHFTMAVRVRLTSLPQTH